MNDERFEELMVKVVDRTANPAEREELMGWLADKPELRVELEQQQALTASIDGWMTRLEADLQADLDRNQPVGRLERGLGIALVLFGMAIMTGWGFVEMMLAPEIPTLVRVASGATVAGGVLLLAHVVRTRLLSGRRDPYDEVIR
jgi:ferric-dicitrate binding protein FerR (iron transport regulator)